MTVLTRLTPVTPGAISDPGIQNANRPLTISEIDSNFSDLYNFTLGKLAKTTDTFTGTLSIAGQLRFNGSVSGYVGFQSASTTANVLYTLPTSDGLNGQVLSTNGTGSLSWINQSAGGGGGGSGSGTSTSRTAFTATAGQTTFNVTYVVGQIDVYMNGSKLIVGTEVTASNGTSVVLAEAASAGDIVEVVVYSTQWISSGSNLYYDQGNVGFGVTNPAARIHIGSAATALATGTLRIDGSDGAGTVNAPVTLNSVTDGATASGGSQFYIETRVPGGALTEKFRIDGDGNIGINNNNPQSALDVTGNVRISGSTTLSGGTANGVLYLNGSKVATSGGNLTYDGTNLGLDAGGGTGPAYLNVSQRSRFGYDGTNVLISDAGTGKDIVFTRITEQMRLTSTGLGIGVTPSYKLDVVGQSRIGHNVLQAAPSSTAILSTAHVMLGGYGGNYLTIGQYDGTGGFAQWIQSSYENPTTAKYNIAFQPLGGNILIGGISGTVNPALNRYVSLQSQTNNDIVGYNLFVNEGVNNRRGSMFLDDANGVFGWDVTASTGVPDYAWYYAGTEKMRLVSSVGNLLIGESYDVNAKLKIYAGNNAQHIRIYEGNHDGSSSTFYYPAISYYARRDNIPRTGDPLSQYGSTASIVFTDRPGTSNYPTAVRTSDIQFWTASNDGGTGLDANPQLRMSITADGSILSYGGWKSTSTSPISFISNSNSGTYNSTVIYANANNTSNSINNGIFIERGRLTDSSSAEIRNFVIGSRGGEVQFVLNKDGNVGIGDSSPTNRLTVNGGIRVGSSERAVIGWYQDSTAGNAFPGTTAYYHIKTSLWAGSNPTGNTQPTMSLIKVTGYDYNGQTILAMMGFHNWSGSLPGLTVQNLGQRDIGLTALVSSDGYVVIRINVSNASYQAWSIDWQQTWLYTWVDIKVTGTALSSATNYY